MSRSSLGGVIIGAGLMGRWHAHALRRLRIPIRACVDIDAARAEQLARRFGVGQVASSPEEVPGEAVWHLCTPPATHVELAQRGLQAGAHLLVEKPLCPTADETEMVVSLAREASRLVCPVHQFLWQPGTLRGLRAIECLGDLTLLRFDASSAGVPGPDGGGPNALVGDILTHALSLVVRLWGPERNYELTASHVRTGQLTVVGGVDRTAIEIHIDTVGRPTRCEALLVGSRSSARLNFFHGYCAFHGGRVSRWQKMSQPLSQSAQVQIRALLNLARRTMRREPAYPGLRELIRRFYVAVQGVGEIPVSGAEALKVARLRDEVLGGSQAL